MIITSEYADEQKKNLDILGQIMGQYNQTSTTKNFQQTEPEVQKQKELQGVDQVHDIIQQRQEKQIAKQLDRVKQIEYQAFSDSLANQQSTNPENPVQKVFQDKSEMIIQQIIDKQERAEWDQKKLLTTETNKIKEALPQQAQPEQQQIIVKGIETEKKGEEEAVSQQKKVPKTTGEMSSNWKVYLNQRKSEISETNLINPPENSKKIQQNDGKNGKNQALLNTLEPLPNTNRGITPIVAMDCQMVMCEGHTGQFNLFQQTSQLARVSIVNYNQHVLLDTFVRPEKQIVNYVTWVSGVRRENLIGAPTLDELKEKINSILHDRVVVGHSLQNDFTALQMTPNRKNLRDISSISFLKRNGKVKSLRSMTDQYLSCQIQSGQHSSIQDARAALAVYKLFEKQIEKQVKTQSMGYDKMKNQVLADLNKQ